ncbi:MAG: M48 family metalloprotease, partial [Armatimonadetes bacterium]|nr:M48 family metalloprotease [Armatimonadota bacterium]
LTNQELRAILAHEVGHLEMRHLRRRQVDFLVSGLVGILLISILPRVFLHESIALSFAGLILDTLPLLPYLLTSRWRRRRWHAQELQADRVGAEMLGDPQLMAHALQKLHTLAFHPDAFPKGVKVSHPSLDARIQCLLGNLPPGDECCAQRGDEEGAPATGETKELT